MWILGDEDVPSEPRMFDVDFLRAVIRGEVPVSVVGERWDEVFAGNVVFHMGPHRVVVFNDCNALDYIDSVDGVDVCGTADPIDMLTPLEQDALLAVLRLAPDDTPTRGQCILALVLIVVALGSLAVVGCQQERFNEPRPTIIGPDGQVR
jgi:hypothetical protein